ncbi:FAD-dependent monooxygenase [Synechococcus sp. CS-1327]|uniref:FAD-dependent monooxygenase n=2 Tax=unclassified Synechococcus TaxID=2626047 RepID=UPI0028805EFD|nr:FAD-dependent monooxygenase [Synechococcus sp. CS-1327]
MPDGRDRLLMRSPLVARVRGAGPTGALAALALASVGWEVELDDPLPPEQLLARGRAYALSHSSRLLLSELQLWNPLAADLVPFRFLQLCDLELAERVPFDGSDLGRAAQGLQGGEAVGWVLQHRPLMELLLERLKADPAIRLNLGNPQAIVPDATPVDLIVAADGSASPSRTALGIGQWRLPYHQACLSVQVRLRGSAADQAWELFRAEGPFAVLPLGGDHHQLVWSAPAGRLRLLESLDPAAFLDSLAGALPDRFQVDALLDAPRAFPVALELARGFQRGNTVLVGETMHRCHPVGGQGLNLCWRDVRVLRRQAERVARGRLGLAAIGRAYAIRRWGDVLLTLLITDLMVRLFSNRQPLPLGLRRLVLALLRRLPPLRRLSLKAMSLGPCQLLSRWSE